MFVTFEGIEGSGKSTQAELLRSFLSKVGCKVTLIKLPGGTKVGRILLDILLNENLKLAPLTELFICCAAAAQAIENFIKPKLLKGEVVICDRFLDSTMAYQGYGRGLSLKFVEEICEAIYIEAEVKPNLTIILDCPSGTGLLRSKERGILTKFEREPLEFYERVKKGYLTIAQKNPGRIKVIDSSRTIEEVWQEIKKEFLLESKKYQ